MGAVSANPLFLFTPGGTIIQLLEVSTKEKPNHQKNGFWGESMPWMEHTITITLAACVLDMQTSPFVHVFSHGKHIFKDVWSRSYSRSEYDKPFEC